MPASSGDNASILTGHASSSTLRSPFAKGPSFTLDTFSNQDFIVKDFVESLSDSAVPISRRSGPASQAFDPKPLIRTFEAAVSRLKGLSEDLQVRETELSGAVRRAEAQHNQNTESLGQKVEQAIDSFHQLDGSLSRNGSAPNGSDVGDNAVVRIGERLEELDQQRQRAQDAKFLIQCWIEVSEKGDLSALENVRRMGGGDGKLRCAHIARQLLKISQRLDRENGPQVNGMMNGINGVNGTNGRVDASPSRRGTQELVEKFLESLEKDLLKEFDNYYRRQNYVGMQECAVALRDFNDGASVMALFVNQHQFFIDRSQLITEEVAGDSETWDRIADPDVEPPGVEPSLQSLIDEVKVVVQDESYIIKQAFPYYDEVLVRFLQRVFQQSIQQRLEMVLDKANSISPLAFLRTLQAARSYMKDLVEDLKSHGLTERPEPVSSQIAATLDQQLDELFVPYFIGTSYIEREKRNLEELYASLLFKFTIYHSKRRKLPTTYLASLSQRGKELLSSAREAYMDRLNSTDLPQSQKTMLRRIAGIKETATDTQIDVTEEDGALSLPNAKRMLKWLAEGVGRGLELSGGSDMPKDVAALLNLLLTNMGELYLETALDAANDLATGQETSKNEPDFSYFNDLRASISMLHLLQTAIHTVLIPLASSNLTIRRDIEKTSNAFISRVEDKISNILQRTVDAVLSWVGRGILSKQQKTDFRPRDDSPMALEQLRTPTCSQLCTFLNRLNSRVKPALSGRSRQVFSAELASTVLGALLEHFKKFNVSLTGGLMVSKDVNAYVELIRSWGIEEHASNTANATTATDVGNLASRMLEVLGEVVNVFVIGPEALRERLRGGVVAGVEAKELRPYILRRDDVGTVGVQAVLNAL
ncbi:exocyst complex component Sec10 [Viridothelium virens]|uniref:Exocyst complex component Sec10 n=1 Tax=Viridothelium virens TaxID=1048519 RepID=A0A6A6HJ79_VIRVR|nr:exocyst complex component Sec10 [Viridothelium virens]